MNYREVILRPLGFSALRGVCVYTNKVVVREKNEYMLTK